MACGLHGEPCKGHPNLYDRANKGREIVSHGVPAQHFGAPAGELIHGDGFHHEGQSWVVKDIRDHERGRTVIAEPRAGMVGRSVVSQMQFGTTGITLEDTGERAFTFDPHQVVARRG